MILVLFILGSICFLTFPFLPAIIEASRPSDIVPLKVTDHTLRDPRARPENPFWYLGNLLGFDDLSDLKKNLNQKMVALNPSILIVDGGLVPEISKTIARVVSGQDLQLKNKKAYLSKILSMGSIVSGKLNSLNEIHALEKLTIDEDSKLIWWATGKLVNIKNGAILTGKLQGTELVQISGFVRFHLIQAPVIESEIKVTDSNVAFLVESLNRARKLLVGNQEFPANSIWDEDLIVRGNLIVRANAKISGNLKVHGDLLLGLGVQVTGNVICNGNLTLVGSTWIGGTVLCEKTLRLGPDVTLGSKDHKVTCSAHRIYIEGPFRTHGLLRAWKYGEFRNLQIASDKSLV